MVVEFHMPEEAHFALQGIYYVFAVITCLDGQWTIHEAQVGWMLLTHQIVVTGANMLPKRVSDLFASAVVRNNVGS